MPTPIQVILDPISLSLLALYSILFTIERVFPAKPQAISEGWYLRGGAAFICYFFLASYLPVMWDKYLLPYQLFDLTGMSVWLSTTIALVVFQVLLYVWHRSMHKSKFLWRAFHQMHHSAERVDTIGAFYFSPLDMIGFTLLGSISLVLIIGIDPQATTYFLLISQFLAVFQHCNIRTPQWLGYVIQRPESHSVHHQKGIHQYNYCDFPVLDMIFGTFRNPKHYSKEVGFYQGASSQVLAMLSWKDIASQKKA